MSQGNDTEAEVQVIVHNQNYLEKTRTENMIQKGIETDKGTEVMILILKEERTDTGKRVEAERGMIMIRTEAGIGTETEEDGPNKNISGVSTLRYVTLLICRLQSGGQLAFCHRRGIYWQCDQYLQEDRMKRLSGNCYCRQSVEVPSGNWLLIPP